MSSASTCRPSRVLQKNESSKCSGTDSRHSRLGWRPTINGFPLSFKESTETAQCLAHVHRDILSFAGSLPPKCSQRDASCGETNCGQRPEANRAWDNRISPVERELASGVRRCQPDIL